MHPLKKKSEALLTSQGASVTIKPDMKRSGDYAPLHLSQ